MTLQLESLESELKIITPPPPPVDNQPKPTKIPPLSSSFLLTHRALAVALEEKVIIFLCTFGVVVFIVLARWWALGKRERDERLKAESEHYHFFSRRR